MTHDDLRKLADTYNNEDGIIMRALADVVEAAEDHQCSDHGTYICHMCRAVARVEAL